MVRFMVSARLEEGVRGRAVPLVAAVEAVDAELRLGAEGAVGAADPVEGGLGPLGVEQLVADADLQRQGRGAISEPISGTSP